MAWKNFEKIPKKKQIAIISAALICFGKDGYAKTAMSEIAVAAGVSKAALFHYFNTKKELYLFLTRYSCEVMAEQMKAGTDDFFESIEIGTNFKLKVIDKYPGMFDFLISFAREEDVKLVDEVMKYNADIIDKGRDISFANVDWNRLQSGISAEEACNLVSWVSDGYIRAYRGSKSNSEMLIELKSYYEILKKAIYKKDFQ